MRPLSQTLALIVLFAVVIAIAAFVSRSDRSDILAWAQANGFTILGLDQTVLDLGPFDWKAKNQRIYRIEVRDAEKHRRIFYWRTSVLWRGPDVLEDE